MAMMYVIHNLFGDAHGSCTLLAIIINHRSSTSSVLPSIGRCNKPSTNHPYRKEHKNLRLVLEILKRTRNACLMFKQLSRQFVLRNPTRIQCHLFSSSSRLLVDPWPLPHTPEHLASTSSADKLPPLPRLNETVETLRARLVYQSRKRGTLESDLLLSTFARDHLSSMTEVELKEYDKVCLNNNKLGLR